jgi:MoaA/NifB/PqqE/SkfB family radical SAM enzyme
MKILDKLQYWLVSGVKYVMTGRKGISEKDAQRKFNRVKWIMRAVTHNVFVERKGTYCPKLWDSAFVDQFGNVFNCCHSRPGSSGNLYKTSMTDIWRKSPRLKLFRWLSRHKALYCALDCILLTEAEMNSTPRKAPAIQHPSVVRVLHGELCNIACPMCWQNHTDKRMISNEVLQNQIDWTQVNDIELQGGEVMAMKQAKEFFLWLTQEQHKKANLISNGTLINDEWARHLVLGSDWVAVSVNAATQEVHEQINFKSKFPRVMENIRRMVQYKRELGAPVTIIYKFSIVAGNLHEIADAIPVAAELGCDKITFGYDVTTVPAYLDAHPELKTELQQKLQVHLAADLPIEIETMRLEFLGLLPSDQAAPKGGAASCPPVLDPSTTVV